MASFGKLLILLFGAASIMCLIAATAVYTQQMGFVTPKGEDPKKFPSRLDKSIAVTNDLVRANNRAYTRWQQNDDRIIQTEVDLYNRREFYRGQLELIVTGKLDGQNPAAPEPIQELVYDSDRLLDISKPTGRKAFIDAEGKPAQPKFYYLAAIAAVAAEMETTQTKNKDTVAQLRKATDVINGQEAPNFVKGLRIQIKEKEQIAVDADLERLHLEDYVSNRRAEAQLFVKRRDSLQARVNEMKKYLKEKAGGAGN